MKWILNEKVSNYILFFAMLFYAAMPLFPSEFFLPFLLIVSAILLLFLLLIKTPFPHHYFFVIKPILFGLLLLDLMYFILQFGEQLSKKGERGIIITVLVLIILATGYYILRTMFSVIMQINPEKQAFIGTRSIYIILFFMFLLFPDIVFSFIIYDLIFSLYDMETGGVKVTRWDQFYFSFSQHFMTAPSKIGNSMIEILLTDNIGQFALSVHTILNKAMEFTGISLFASLLINGFYGKTKVDKYS